MCAPPPRTYVVVVGGGTSVFARPGFGTETVRGAPGDSPAELVFNSESFAAPRALAHTRKLSFPRTLEARRNWGIIAVSREVGSSPPRARADIQPKRNDPPNERRPLFPGRVPVSESSGNLVRALFVRSFLRPDFTLD